jgi:hypothetical protein
MLPEHFYWSGLDPAHPDDAAPDKTQSPRMPKKTRRFSVSSTCRGCHVLQIVPRRVATLQMDNAAITTNAATIVLDGPNSLLVTQSNTNVLSGFATNTSLS